MRKMGGHRGVWMRGMTRRSKLNAVLFYFYMWYSFTIYQLTHNTTRHIVFVDCAGVHNSFQGKRRREIPVVHWYVEVDIKSNFKWGSFANLPAIVSTKCNGIGIEVGLDGGKVCADCLYLRLKKGNSNPISLVNPNFSNGNFFKFLLLK